MNDAAFLEDVLEARGLAVPAPPAGDVPAYATVREACAAAVAFETQNVALYDRLLAAAETAASGPLPEDVKQAFAEGGLSALSVQEIRERSGVSVGSLYHHFGSREGIVLALYERWGTLAERQ